MLGKLLKYELKNTFKFLIIFYILSICFAGAARILGDNANSTFISVLAEIFKGASISMMCSTIINNSMRLWVMFKGSLYGDESYLAHTLPVKKSAHYLARILNAAITLVVSLIVVLASFLIIFYSDAMVQMFKGMLLPLAETYDFSILGIGALFTVLIYVEFLNIIQCGFSGVILGHKFNNSKTLFSVIFGLIVYSISQGLVVICVLFAGAFNSDILNIFTSNTLPSFDLFKTIIFIVTLSYTAISFIICFLNIKFFAKGVNVD